MAQTIDLITDQTLSSDGVFTSVTLAYDYDEIEIWLATRSTEAVTEALVELIINKDTSTNNYWFYGDKQINGTNGLNFNGANPTFGRIPGASTVSNQFGWLRAWTLRPKFETYLHQWLSTFGFLVDTDNMLSGMVHHSWYSNPDQLPSPNAIETFYLIPDGYPTNLFYSGSQLIVRGWR